jgi:GTP-binding protein YchF
MLADLESLEKKKNKQARAAKSGDKRAQQELELIERLEPILSDGKPANTIEATPEELAIVKSFFLLTAKPILYVCNVAEEDLSSADTNEYVKKVRDYVAQQHDAEVVVVSAEIEAELGQLPEEERKEYLDALGVTESGVGNLIRAAYHLLGLRTYLTTGEKETRAWTIRAGDKAPRAAGVIHSDFEKAFISAETIAYEDLVAAGSFAKARELGKLRTEGKEYVVQDGDVMEFKTYV